MDPFSQSHQEAVELFQRHFHLARSRSDLEDLRLLLRHYSKIPYENLSKIIKVARNQNPEDKFRMPQEVIQDRIEHRLGGTCFSLTYFLEEILHSWGYSCYKAMAHMSAGENIHCVIVAELKGSRYLVDPGYLLWEPLPFPSGGPQVCYTPQGGVELQHDPSSGDFHLFTFNARGRKWRYRFADWPVPQDEFRQHWVASFSKPSLRKLLLNQLTEEGLLYIRGNH
ncbi:MAG: arylamine N-acetyltransferase, partial [candidate division NC10 bacterium]|nr:arylamine N-acetyltransferase [candidate division NC10 bacterium]